MLQQRLPRQTHGFCNRFLGDTPPPFFDDRLPRQARGDLLQHIRHQNTRASKGGLAVTDVWVSDQVTSQDLGLCSLCHYTSPAKAPKESSDHELTIVPCSVGVVQSLRLM